MDISILCTFKRMRDILQLGKPDDKLSKDKVPQETVAGVRSRTAYASSIPDSIPLAAKLLCDMDCDDIACLSTLY